jgi:hypothetical protein
MLLASPRELQVRGDAQNSEEFLGEKVSNEQYARRADQTKIARWRMVRNRYLAVSS